MKPKAKGLTLTSIATLVAVVASLALAMSTPAQRHLSPGSMRNAKHTGKAFACARCHQAFSGVPDKKCEGCHRPIARQRVARHGRHAGMAGPCINCHSLHKTPGKPGRHVDPDSVKHSRLSFRLERHERQSCAACHGRDFTRFDKRFSRRCVDCHLLLLNTARAATRRGIAWAASLSPAKKIRHLRTADAKCIKCHVGPGAVSYDHARARLKFFGGKHKDANCADCHKSGAFVRTGRACRNCHLGGHGPKYRNRCRTCHSFRAWKPALPPHNGKLTGAHPQLKCARCHPRKQFSGLDWSCKTCHSVQPHGDGIIADCDSCHTQTAWKPAKMDHKAASGNCSACHKPPQNHYGAACARCHSLTSWKPAKMDHALVSGACSTCHKPPGGHFGGDCKQCHSTGGWKPAKAAHAISLSGTHTKLACASCHVGGRYSGLSWACSSCHRTAHNGSYSSTCASCHSQTGWKPATLNHGAVSGDCSTCHAAPGGHFAGSCSQCHRAGGGWSSNFNHPRAGEHSYKSFPCASCHPSGYGSYSCLKCHDSNAPND